METPLKTLYTASMSLQAFLFLSTVCPVYFIDILSTLSLFLGSTVIVYGTSITTNASGTQDPTWECFIDNSSIGWSLASTGSQNNWELCSGGRFQDGPHLLTVKVNVSNQQTFWFDYIQYTPLASTSVSLNQSLLLIDPSNSAIEYSPGWQSTASVFTIGPDNIFQTLTHTTGSTLSYVFTGS